MKEIAVKLPYHAKGLELDGVHIALVDDDSFDILSAYVWSPYKGGNTIYAKSGNVIMHRLVMGNPKGLHIHHINGNGLDNRKENLVILTSSEHSRVPKR